MDEKTLDELCDRHYQATLAAVQAAVGQPLAADDPAVKAGLEAIGRVCGVQVCVDDIQVETSLESALRGQGETYAEGVGLGRLYASVFDLAGSEVLGEEPSPDTVAIRDFQLKVYDALLYENLSVLVPYPSELHTDDDGELHCETGPAIAWPGQREYYWHGQEIDAVVIEAPESVTAAYLRDLPAEQRRASYEALGHDRVVTILGCKTAETNTIAGLSYELLRGCDEQWLRMQSPPLQDGSQPYYVEPVHEDCGSIAEALGWRATGELGTRVRYSVES